MRRMLMAGWLVMIVTPSAWGQGWLPPGVAERVNQASNIRMEFGAGLLVMRRPRVEGEALSGVLRVPKAAPRVLGIPIRSADGQPIDWRRSVDTLIPIAQVLTLEVQDGNHWRRGALIGAGAGAGSGVLFSLLVVILSCFGSCGPGGPDWSSMVPGTAGGAALGLMVGAVLGTGSPRWAMIHRRGEVLPATRW